MFRIKKKIWICFFFQIEPVQSINFNASVIIFFKIDPHIFSAPIKDASARLNNQKVKIYHGRKNIKKTTIVWPSQKLLEFSIYGN